MQQMGWSSQVRGFHSVKYRALVQTGTWGLLLFLFSSNAYAADMGTVLANLRSIIVPLTSLVLVCCFVAGMTMIFGALTKMKKFGQMQTMMSQPGEFSGPIVGLIVGAMLIYLPTSTDFFMNSIFGASNSIFGGSSGSINYQALGEGSSLLSYSGSGGLGQQWADLANTLVLFMQFLGFLSFIKGFLIVQKSVAPGHQPGTFSKGLTHIIGGIVLINFVGAINILKNTIYGS